MKRPLVWGFLFLVGSIFMRYMQVPVAFFVGQFFNQSCPVFFKSH